MEFFENCTSIELLPINILEKNSMNLLNFIANSIKNFQKTLKHRKIYEFNIAVISTIKIQKTKLNRQF